MSSPNVPPFDAIDGAVTQFRGFGELLLDNVALVRILRANAAKTRIRLCEGFGRELNDPSRIPEELDSIIAEMWNADWNPATGNVSLFVCDFGVVLSTAVLDLLGGEPTFRSLDDMTDFSVFWAEAKFEAFPFHKVLKCLYDREGESVAGFVDAVSSRVRRIGGS